MKKERITYAEAVIDIGSLETSKRRILKMIKSTFEGRKEVLRVFDHYADLIEVGEKTIFLSKPTISFF